MSSPDARPVLEVADLHAGYGDLVVLRGIDLEIADGTTTAVLGPNGAGKTTLVRAIAGDLPLVRGTIALDGRQVHGTPPHVRLRDVGWVPEGRMLFGDYTVRDNLYLSARAAGVADAFEESLAFCIELFPVIGERIRASAGNLSGGQQQMVAIARAIVRRPRLLLLDEPSMGLAPLVLEAIRDALARLKQQGLSILVTEQNVPWLEDIIDNVVVLGGGRVVLRGGPALLADRDAMRSIYLGV